MTLLQFVSEAKHETGRESCLAFVGYNSSDFWKEGGGHEDSGHGICICEKERKLLLPADLALMKENGMISNIS